MTGIAPPFPEIPEQRIRIAAIRAEETRTEEVATHILARTQAGIITWRRASWFSGWEYIGRGKGIRVLLSFAPRTLNGAFMTGAKFEIKAYDGKKYHELTHPPIVWRSTKVDELYDYVKDLAGWVQVAQTSGNHKEVAFFIQQAIQEFQNGSREA